MLNLRLWKIFRRRRDEETHQCFDCLTFIVAGKSAEADSDVGICLVVLRMILVELLNLNADEIFILGLMLCLKEVDQIHTLVVLQRILELETEQLQPYLSFGLV